MIKTIQKMQCPKCLFYDRAMKDYRFIVLSFKEIYKFLLEHGVSDILSKRFSQDDVENYFGRQRAIDRRCDNATVRDFSYNDDTIKLQYLVRPIAGNLWRPALKFIEIITELLPFYPNNYLLLTDL